MTQRDDAFEQLLQRAMGNDLEAACCRNFLLSCMSSDVHGGWATRSLAVVRPELQAAVIEILMAIGSKRWMPDPKHETALTQRDAGIHLTSWASATQSK
jgi:hypothetical protein